MNELSNEVVEREPTFAEEIEEYAGGSRNIEAVVVSGNERHGPDVNAYPNGKPYEGPEPGKVMRWSQARPHLDYTYDAGWGSPECHSVFVWCNDNRVIFVSQYDGSTGLNKIPRDPEDGFPYMPGGG